jgi:hypothetical protein
MNEEQTAATPAEQVPEPAEQVQTPVESSTEETTEQTEQQPEPQEPKKEPWFQKRIGELTREKYEARRQAEAIAQEAAQLRDALARVQQGESPQPNANPLSTESIEQAAARLVAERSFNEACNKVYETGKQEFHDFDAALANLQLVGGVSREFLEIVSASDAGAKLIHHLGSDLDEAARIASLPPLQLAREMTKLELRLAQKPAKPVSNAPAPITPIAAAKASTKDPAEMTDAEFAKWRKAQIAQRF